MTFEAVIGLEVHAQLNTQSKIFSASPTLFGAEPNTQANTVDLGLPGVLPVLNKEVVSKAIQFGLGIDADINQHSIFARKNYFYPDLPKGYQISQYEDPIVGKGKLEITLEDGSKKNINITRAHLEEDAGKSLHEDFHGFTGIDLNRAGIPLLEIVSEPELTSAKEAVAYLKALHRLVRYLNICDGNMQEGSFRCDANVSVRPKGQTALGTRTEIKNLNSFRFVEKAINYEIERQIDAIEQGESVIQETRLYDANKDQTRSMRTKEDADDYRYFPDPDLPPVIIDDTLIAKQKDELPELPQVKQHRFAEVYGLSEADANILTDSRPLADYYEEVVSVSKHAKLSCNWVISELLGVLNKHEQTITDSKITAAQLGQLILRITDDTISGKIAKQVFELMWQEGGEPDDIIEKKNLKQVTDTGQIEALVDDVINNNQDQVQQYLEGKDKVLGFLVGQIMKASKGQANPGLVNKLLKEKLKR